MTNADYIRDMDNDRLARFLWSWKLNSITSFMMHGGEELMNAADLRKWLDSEDFKCAETKVSPDSVYDSEFNLKETGK